MSEVDARLREALDDLQGYLADSLAPLLVAEAVNALIEYPPAVTAEQLRVWAFFQFEGRHGSTPISDLLYHAIKKVQQLEVHHLVAPERFGGFLTGLAKELLVACPPEERERLAGLLRHLRESVGGATALVDRLHRAPEAMAHNSGPTVTPRAAGESAPLTAAEARDLRRFSLALEQALASRIPAAPPTADGAEQQLLVLAAAGAHSAGELEGRLARLRAAGVDGGATGLLRSLISAVPDWGVVLPRGSASGSGAVEAVHRVVRFAGDREAANERWKELLAAAAEQFNARSFGRAMALLDLAERMVRDDEVDLRLADIELGHAQEAYEIPALLTAAAERRHHPVLRRLLDLFPAWSVRELLDALVFQPDSKRRRLLIALLEVWGSAARPEVVNRLDLSIAERSRDPNAWWFQRNLVFLMHRLPREEESDPARELALVAPFSSLEHHPSFQREAIQLLGQLPGQLGVPTLVQRLAEAERALESAPPPLPAEEIWKAMNALAGALARNGAPPARRALLDHALARRTRDGDALARLRELGRYDLGGDRETVTRLLAALRELAPRKLLGFVVARRTEELGHVLRALSGTSLAEVRQAIADLVARHPELEPLRYESTSPSAAGGESPLLGESDGERTPGEATAPVSPAAAASLPAPQVSLVGDLELFGLAGLLQSFQQSELSGRLVLRDPRGQTFAEILLHGGRLASCRTGHLADVEAFYQLFEAPSRGNFEFTRAEAATPSPPGLRELMGLLLEAMRRYDELQRLRAMVPEGLRLRGSGSRPTAPEEERDGVLVRKVWETVRDGGTAGDCERAAAVDSYRVRTLLAHWLEEGSLAPIPAS